MIDLKNTINQLIPYIMKKIVYLGKNPNNDELIHKKFVTIFYRGLIIDELIEIETEIEDIILNDKFGVDSNGTKSERDEYRENKLRRKEAKENKFENKIKELGTIRKKYFNDKEKKVMESYIVKIEIYRHYFAHREIKFDSSDAFLYIHGWKKERRIKIDIKFIEDILKETKILKELLDKMKKQQERIIEESLK